MVSPGPGLLQRVISGSVVLQWPGSEVMFRAPALIKGHADHLCPFGYHRPCQCQRIVLHLGPWSEGPVLIPGAMETYGHTPRPRARPGSMALLQLGSQVLCMAPVTTESSTDTWGLVSNQLYRCISVTEESVPELPQRAVCVSMVLLCCHGSHWNHSVLSRFHPSLVLRWLARSFSWESSPTLRSQFAPALRKDGLTPHHRCAQKPKADNVGLGIGEGRNDLTSLICHVIAWV